MEICTSEADSTAEKTKDSNHGHNMSMGGVNGLELIGLSQRA